MRFLSRMATEGSLGTHQGLGAGHGTFFITGGKEKNRLFQLIQVVVLVLIAILYLLQPFLSILLGDLDIIDFAIVIATDFFFE